MGLVFNSDGVGFAPFIFDHGATKKVVIVWDWNPDPGYYGVFVMGISTENIVSAIGRYADCAMVKLLAAVAVRHDQKHIAQYRELNGRLWGWVTSGGYCGGDQVWSSHWSELWADGEYQTAAGSFDLSQERGGHPSHNCRVGPPQQTGNVINDIESLPLAYPYVQAIVIAREDLPAAMKIVNQHHVVPKGTVIWGSRFHEPNALEECVDAEIVEWRSKIPTK